MTGYRVLPHVADVILEAWAPERLGCFEAAVMGLVGAVVDVGDARADRRVEFAVAATSDEDLLVRLLEEVIFLVDAEGRIPVAVTVAEAPEGLRGWFESVSVEQVEETGALPKGVSRSGVQFACDDRGAETRWRCRVMIDV